MNDDTERRILTVLEDIRDDQRELLQAAARHRALVEEQLNLARTAVGESAALQRLALSRQRTITLVALPAIVACVVAIAYLIVRYS
jgi:hypothetical protein